MDERLGFGELIQQQMTDTRGTNTQLPLAEALGRTLEGGHEAKMEILTRKGSEFQ